MKPPRAVGDQAAQKDARPCGVLGGLRASASPALVMGPSALDAPFRSTNAESRRLARSADSGIYRYLRARCYLDSGSQTNGRVAVDIYPRDRSGDHSVPPLAHRDAGHSENLATHVVPDHLGGALAGHPHRRTHARRGGGGQGLHCRAARSRSCVIDLMNDDDPLAGGSHVRSSGVQVAGRGED